MTAALMVALGPWVWGGDGTIPLSKSLARSLKRTLRIAQDLLAYDFYTERLVSANGGGGGGGQLARLINWFDRYVVDGWSMPLGLASLTGGRKPEIQHFSVSLRCIC
jgi:NAD(P)H-quinone oxidoreductase subunit 5